VRRADPMAKESYGSPSVMNVVWCQVEVFVTGLSLVQRSCMEVCLLWVLCVVRLRTVRLAYPLYRGDECKFFCFVCSVLSVRRLCNRLISWTEESYGYLSVLIVVSS